MPDWLTRPVFYSLKGNTRCAHLGPAGKRKAAGSYQKPCSVERRWCRAHLATPRLPSLLSASLPRFQRGDGIKPSTISNGYVIHSFYIALAFFVQMDLQALLIVRKDPYQLQEMRERIAAGRANAMLAQVQVCLAAFLGPDCRIWCQLEWATPDLWDTLKLEIRESMASSLLRSLPSLCLEWLGRSGMFPSTILFNHHGCSRAGCYSSDDDYAEKDKTLNAVTYLIVEGYQFTFRPIA